MLTSVSGRFKADGSSGWLTGVTAGIRPAQEKLQIRSLGCDLKDGTESAALSCTLLPWARKMGICDMLWHVWVFVLCVCTWIMLYVWVCHGTFAPATFPPLTGVAHVECVAQWVADGSGARGITCPWHCSCSLQMRPEHISAGRELNAKWRGGFLKKTRGKMHTRQWNLGADLYTN